MDNPLTLQEAKPFKRIMVEAQNGLMVDITDLPKEHYEYFLELTNQIRMAYIAIQSRPKNQANG